MMQIVTDREFLPKLLSEQVCPEWWSESASRFEQIITDQFPCTFASIARLTYCFVERQDLRKGLVGLTESLARFVTQTASDSRTEAQFRTFIAFFEPREAPASVDDYRIEFWDAIQFLHDHDPGPWPEAVPQHPGHPEWSFCFAGQPLFINASSPAHVKRPSRNLGPSLTLVIQLRRGLDSLAPPDGSGDHIRQEIRKRLTNFDLNHPVRQFTPCGRSHARDWKIYFIPDEGLETTGPCPLRPRID